VQQIDAAVGRKADGVVPIGLSGPAGTTAGSSIPIAL
jgi:hypothetical protein